MSVVEQVLQYCCKFLVEFRDARVLVNVEVKEMTESVVVCLKAEHIEALVQHFEHILRVEIRRW
jgi:hypothetical protein